MSRQGSADRERGQATLTVGGWQRPGSRRTGSRALKDRVGGGAGVGQGASQLRCAMAIMPIWIGAPAAAKAGAWSTSAGRHESEADEVTRAGPWRGRTCTARDSSAWRKSLRRVGSNHPEGGASILDRGDAIAPEGSRAHLRETGNPWLEDAALSERCRRACWYPGRGFRRRLKGSP
jgi:hypothetical protein